MKTKIVNQEILLMTTTTFASREWCEKDVQGSKASSAGEQLEEACWNGLLDELLPGIIEKSASGKKLLLWQIIPCGSFLEIELCESPVHVDNALSINPYRFLPMISCS
jgi:hypothetical protein